MQHSMLLIRPSEHRRSLSNSKNMFSSVNQSQSLPSIQKTFHDNRQAKLYDFVGSTQFKKTKFMLQANQAKIQKQSDHIDRVNNQTDRNFSKFANTTIKRQTILSKLSKDQQIQLTKQKRNLDKYKQYQQYWNDQATKMKSLINKKRSSILQVSQAVIAEENPDKTDIINNHIIKYWEMSLRNPNPILLRHIKGNRYGQVELQQKLQMSLGTRQVENSIPKLPLQQLKSLKRGELSLSGRSKLNNESPLTQRYLQKSNIFSQNTILNQQQVYRINYQGAKKWQSTQGLSG